MGVSGMMCHSCLPLMWPLPPAPRVHCSCTRGEVPAPDAAGETSLSPFHDEGTETPQSQTCPRPRSGRAGL